MSKGPSRRRTRPRSGGRYRIVATGNDEYRHLVGAIVTVDVYGGLEGIPAPMVRIAGRIEGVQGSIDFDQGVALVNINDEKGY